MTRPVEPVLSSLRQQLLRMGSLAEAILEKSLQSLWRRDTALAREVKIDDLEIDRVDIAVDDLVLRILATQAPVADDLRNVIACKMIATDLERVGDLAAYDLVQAHFGVLGALGLRPRQFVRRG